MAINLIELVKSQLGDSVLEQLGGAVGESTEHTRSAVEAGVPTILGSIVDRVSSDPDAAGMLVNALDGVDDGIAGDFGSYIGGDTQASLQKKGGDLLGGLLGDNMGSVIDMISSFSGASKGSSSSILGMLMPLVMGVIGKQVKSQGLDLGGLVNMLGGQKDMIGAAMPSGMGDLLSKSGILSGVAGMLTGGTGKIADAASDAVSGAAKAAGDAADSATAAASKVADAASHAASSAADTAGQAASAGSSMIRRLLPIAIAVIVILLLLKYLT